MKYQANIYLHGEGHEGQQGPFTEQEIRRYWAYGIIKNNDWIWQEGMNDYMRVKDFFDISIVHIAQKPSRQTVIVRSSPRHAGLHQADDGGIIEKPWILQVFAWLVALAATVCFLSLPAGLWFSVVMYLVSLLLLGWFIWIRKSVIAWLSLCFNVTLIALVFFL